MIRKSRIPILCLTYMSHLSPVRITLAPVSYSKNPRFGFIKGVIMQYALHFLNLGKWYTRLFPSLESIRYYLEEVEEEGPIEYEIERVH